MLHRNRKWGVSRCETTEELVDKLTAYSWTLCTAFETAAGIIWANDTTCADAVQEFAVLRPHADRNYAQVESITVSWCDASKLDRYVREADSGVMLSFAGTYGTVHTSRLERNHDRCLHCA